MELSLETRTHGNAHIIDVAGKVDLYSSPRMRKCIFDTIKRQRPESIVMELSGVTYMDSSGIATLVEGLQLSNESHIRFKLTGLSEKILEVFQLARLETAFDIYLSEDEALQKRKT